MIRGYAYLEHARFQRGVVNSFIVDAAIAGSSYRTVDHVLCGSLQINKGIVDRIVDARLYSIEAKVCSSVWSMIFV